MNANMINENGDMVIVTEGMVDTMMVIETYQRHGYTAYAENNLVYVKVK